MVLKEDTPWSEMWCLKFIALTKKSYLFDTVDLCIAILFPCMAIIYTFMLLNILMYVLCTSYKVRSALRYGVQLLLPQHYSIEHFVGTGVNCSLHTLHCMLQLQFRRSTATRFTQKKWEKKRLIASVYQEVPSSMALKSEAKSNSLSAMIWLNSVIKWT